MTTYPYPLFYASAGQETPRFPPIETTPLIIDLLTHHAPVAIGISGGKDSDVAAFETHAYLQALGHKGPCILIHSDLGRS